MIFLCTKRNNKFSIEKNFKEYTDKLKDGLYQIEFEKQTRSNQQNRFYWKYIRILSEETGDNENDLHEFFKRKFLPPRFVRVLGREIKLPASTSKLSKKDFSEYIMRIEALTGILSPDTEKYFYEEQKM